MWGTTSEGVICEGTTREGVLCVCTTEGVIREGTTSVDVIQCLKWECFAGRTPARMEGQGGVGDGPEKVLDLKALLEEQRGHLKSKISYI